MNEILIYLEEKALKHIKKEQFKEAMASLEEME